jgi:hypothetical protein
LGEAESAGAMPARLFYTPPKKPVTPEITLFTTYTFFKVLKKTKKTFFSCAIEKYASILILPAIIPTCKALLQQF